MLRFAATLLLLACATLAAAQPWPQFHGPNTSGLYTGEKPLPAKLDPAANLLWKTELPKGHSSPVVAGGRVFLTAERGQDLLVLALDAETGKLLWEFPAPHGPLETIHGTSGSHAQPSPATDGERVVSFFGSSGLFCHDRDGKLLWTRPLGPFKNDFGAGSSPVIVGDRVILNQDHDEDSFLFALDKRTGEIVWRAGRPEYPRSYATPVLWKNNGETQIVVAGSLNLAGYALESGERRWLLPGLARIANTTPVAAADGMLYCAFWSPGADGGDRIAVPDFAGALAADDKNGDGVLEPDEPTNPSVKSRFSQIDRNKDGKITEPEYTSMKAVFEQARNVAMRIEPGAAPDAAPHSAWTYEKNLPYVPSPVVCGPRMYMVKNGGILTSFDAATGKVLKQERVEGRGDYYASAVAGDGKLYLLSERGVATVVDITGESWTVLSSHDFAEDAYSTPALADGRIHLRTNAALYCFR